MVVSHRNDGFDALFEAVYPRARGLAYRILGDMPAAEDAAAEAMARAVARWPSIGPLPHREGWILRVTSNIALDAARRRVQRNARRPKVDLRPDPDLGDAVVLRVALVEALAKLPRRQRDAIVFVHLLGYTPTEASIAMGVSASSVCQHIRRGRQSLEHHMSDVPAPQPTTEARTFS